MNSGPEAALPERDQAAALPPQATTSASNHSTNSGSPSNHPSSPTPSEPNSTQNQTDGPRAWSLERDGWATREDALIRPGSRLENEFGTGCTVNFLFTNPNGTKAYLGTAAHCYGIGASDDPTCDDTFATLDDHPDAFMRLYKPNDLVGLPPPVSLVGRFVYSSFVTMEAIGETDWLKCMMNDFALIELNQDAIPLANPAVWQYGGPTQLGAPRMETGDIVHTYGGTALRNYPAGGTRPRDGIVTPSERDTLDPDSNTTVHAIFPGGCIGGDSGSPALDETGQAMGVVIRSLAGGGPSCLMAYLSPMLEYMRIHAGIEVVLATDDSFAPSPATALRPAVDVLQDGLDEVNGLIQLLPLCQTTPEHWICRLP